MTPFPADVAAAARAARAFVKYALVLVGVVAFLILDFGTQVPSHFGGSPKQVAFILIMICALPLMVAYFPLSWIAARLVTQRLSNPQQVK